MVDKHIIASVTYSFMNDPYAGLINGMVFGIPISASPQFQSNLRAVGLIHLVVLSGMNISLIAAFITVLTARLSRVLSTLITMLMLIIYTYFVGFEAPILRALIMGLLTHVSFLYGKRAIPLYILFVAGFACLLYKPDWISSLSFHLSYGATLGLMLFGPRPRSTSPEGARQRVMEYISTEFTTSLSAQVFTIPIIYYFFHQVSLISPLANILVSWTILPITVFGMLTALLGSMHTVVGLPFAAISYALSAYIIAVTEILASVPYSSITF